MPCAHTANQFHVYSLVRQGEAEESIPAFSTTYASTVGLGPMLPCPCRSTYVHSVLAPLSTSMFMIASGSRLGVLCLPLLPEIRRYKVVLQP